MKVKIEKNAIYVVKKLAANSIVPLCVSPLGFDVCEVETEKKDEARVCKIFGIKKPRRPKKHLAVVAGVFATIFLIAVFFMQNLIFRVVVSGASDEVRAQVQQILSKKTFFKKSVDKKGLERAIMQHPRVTLVSVNFVGNSLVINIKEAENVIFEEGVNIVSSVEGSVESINVVSGTAMVKKGDYVMPGQVLIAAAIASGGEAHQVVAIGQVGILTYLQRTEIFQENREEVVRTGRTVIKNKWTFRRHADILKMKRWPFALYEVESKKSEAIVGGFLPMKKTQFTIFELDYTQVFEPFYENEARIVANVLQHTKDEAGIHKRFYSENVAFRELHAGIFEIAATVQFLVYEG